jgi:hypothetical protein
MKTLQNGISPELCKELYEWAGTYIYGKSTHPLGFPNPVKTTTNSSWNNSIIKDSKPVIIYFPPDEIALKVKEELMVLGLVDMTENLSTMVYVWTSGSYIPMHEDGFSDTDRKVFTAYLNEKWSIQDGGTLNYFDKDDQQWKVLVPEQGMLVYNDNNEKHYTTVSNDGKLRVSLQMFTY